MKNQSTKILLGVCLIAIWGLLGFRISAKLQGNDQIALLEAPIANRKVLSHPFTFELDLDYRDPFGKSVSYVPNAKMIKANPIKSVNSISLINKKKAIPAFPKVEYRGDITSRTGRKAAVLKVENEFINLGLGEQYKDLELRAIYQDSIQIAYQSFDKIIPKVKE